MRPGCTLDAPWCCVPLVRPRRAYERRAAPLAVGAGGESYAQPDPFMTSLAADPVTNLFQWRATNGLLPYPHVWAKEGGWRQALRAYLKSGGYQNRARRRLDPATPFAQLPTTLSPPLPPPVGSILPSYHPTILPSYHPTTPCGVARPLPLPPRHAWLALSLCRHPLPLPLTQGGGAGGVSRAPHVPRV